MDLRLDMKTIFVSVVVGHLFAAVLISAYWRHQKHDKTVSTFFYAKCAEAIAWFFIILRGGISDVLTISFANSLLFLGSALEIVAVLSLQNTLNRTTKKIYMILTAANIAGFHFILLFYNQEAVRIAFASVGTAVLLLIPAYRLIRERASSSLMKTMGYFYLLVLIMLLGRAVTALLSKFTMSFFAPGIFQTFSFLSLYLIMIIGNTGFVLLLKERSDRELLRLASYDDLTGTLNRRTFITCVKKCLSAYARKRKPLSLLLFDVDHFKIINDTYGHDVGDLVLQDLAERIKMHLAAEDLFARYGGDEFAILLPGKDETESAETAERFRKAIEEAAAPGLRVKYTISLGVLTVVPDASTHWDTLYTSCDQALYSAKREGRNRFHRNL